MKLRLSLGYLIPLAAAALLGSASQLKAQLQFTLSPNSITNPKAGGQPLTPSSSEVTDVVTVNTPTTVNFTTLIQTNPANGTWLNVFSSGRDLSAPTSLQVRSNPSGLAPATYTGSITFQAAGYTPATLGVTMVVSGAGSGSITVSPNPLNVSYTVGQANPTAQFTISAPTLPSQFFSVTGATTPFGGTWLPTSIATNFLNSAGNAVVNVPVSAAGLAESATPYIGTITISIAGQTATLPINLTVSGTGAGVVTLVPSTGLTFNYVTGSAAPVNQTFTVNALTVPNATYTVTTSQVTPAAQTWLNAFPTSSQLVGGTSTITVFVSPVGLPANTYTGNVTVTVTGQAAVTEQITLVVSNTGNTITASTNTLQFSYTPGGSFPLQQNVTLTAPAAQANQVYSIAISTVPAGGTWLSTNPFFAGSFIGGGAVLGVNANPTGLANGIYQGTITISSANLNPATINVTFSVGTTSGGQISFQPNPAMFNYVVGASVQPSPQNITLTTSATGTQTVSFTSSQTWIQAPTSIQVNNGSVIFTVGVAPVGLQAGSYTGTIFASIASLGLTGTLTVNLTISGSSTGVSLSPPSLTFNVAQGAASATGQVVTILVPGASSNPAWSAVVTSGTFITIGPSSGSILNNQDTFTVNVLPAGLPQGQYSGQVSVTVLGYPVATLPVTMNVGATGGGGSTGLIPQSVTFNFQSSGALPAIQTVSVGSPAGSSGFFTVSTIYAQAAAGWLTVNPLSGSAPNYLALAVNPTGLPAGNYQATVNLSFSTSTLSLPVMLNVSSSPLLTTTPNSSTFYYQVGTAAVTQTQQISLNSTGGTLAFSTSTTGGSWLTATPSSTFTPATATIGVNAAGLAPGTYTGTVTISPSGATALNYPVTLVVSNNPFLIPAPASLQFTATPGAASPTPQSLTLTSTSGQALGISVQASSGAGSWLSATATSSTTPSIITATVFSSGLPEGIYFGLITVSTVSGAADNSPLVIPVILTVGNPTGGFTVAPTTLTFSQSIGGAAPPGQTLNVSAGSTTVGFSAQATTSTGGPWLTVAPASGITPTTLTVSANGSTLPAGSYTGTVTVFPAGGVQQTVTVTLNVVQPVNITAAPTTLTFAATPGGGAPPSQTINVAAGGAVAAFTATASVGAGLPPWLTVTPTSGATPANITASVNPQGLAIGTYQGAITISGGITPVTVNVTFTLGVVTVLAVSNAASGIPGAIAPGEIVLIAGTNIGPTTLVPARLNAQGLLDNTLGGVRVLFSGIPAPLVYVRNDFVSAIVPYQLSGRVSTSIQVEYQGALSSPLDVRLVDSAPGIFTVNSQGFGQGVIQNFPSYTLNGPGNPIDRGGFAIIYATGEGQTSPVGIDGLIGTPQVPRVPIANVSARIGGRPAQVLYAGSVSGSVLGLMAVIVTVPADSPTGSVPVDITAGTAQSPAGVTISVR